MELGGEEFTYRALDGTMLSGRDYGRHLGSPCPLVCLPGLTRNVRDFDAVARFLSDDHTAPRRVLSFDYRGRGRSQAAHDRTYTPQVEANDVLAGLVARDIREAAFLGTSRGGLLCMAFAVMRPGILKAVILNDIGAVIHVGYLARLRDYINDESVPPSWEEAETLLRRTFSESFTKLRDSDWQRVARQIYDSDKGRPAVAFDTALIKSLKGITGTSDPIPIWPYFQTLAKVPLLALRGANSPLFDQTTLHAMVKSNRRMEAYVAPDEGHAPLLWDRPVQDRIARFLEFHT
ncbi:MAG: alpha/beta hydrolase [Pseudomonadota bacterium]